MSYKAMDGTRQWDGSKKVPEERMAVKMQSFARTGITPDIAGADLSYALKLQYARWKAKGLRTTMEITPAEYTMPQSRSKNTFWSDEKYTHERRMHMANLSQKYYKGDKCIDTQESQIAINAIVTDTTVETSAVESDYYCCQSCGAISRIKELMTGCPYCQTKFQISDLFPKVTNFYFYDDDSSQVKKIKNIGIAAGILIFILAVIYNMMNVEHFNVMNIVGAVAGGAFGGYAVFAFSTIGYGICKGMQGVGEVVGSRKAERKIEKKLKSLDSTFSYKLFEGQLISFLKMTLFSDDTRNLACFEGTYVPEKYKDLIDMNYHGTVALKSMETTGNIVKLNMKVFLRNTYCINNKIKIKDEEIPIQVAKNISTPTKAGFSIRRSQCKNCGGSFDATHQRICPYCQTVYDMKDEDWVIINIGE